MSGMSVLNRVWVKYMKPTHALTEKPDSRVFQQCTCNTVGVNCDHTCAQSAHFVSNGKCTKLHYHVKLQYLLVCFFEIGHKLNYQQLKKLRGE